MTAKNSPFDTRSLGLRAAEMLDALAACTDEPGCITRLSFGPAHRAAADLVLGWMAEAGLDAEVTETGTVRGRTQPTASPSPSERTPRRRLLIGSHIDTVPDAGRFDGMLGVVVGILAAGELNRGREHLPFDLEVLAFGDEEGLRFSGTSIGSLSLARALPQELLDDRDDEGSLSEALAGFGLAPRPRLDELPYDPDELVGYLEVHIEQGPVLEAMGAPLGVVSSIAAATRLRARVRGDGGHAGTVPMALRRDALAAAAELVGAVEKIGLASADGVVCTVGEFTVGAPAANSIAGSVEFSIDLRAPYDDLLSAAQGALVAELDRIAHRRAVEMEVETEYEGAATICDDDLSDAFNQALVDLGLPAPRLPSGAGHDAQSLAEITPVAMLFVRCRAGASHDPAEYASPEDIGLAVAALVRTLSSLALQTTAAGIAARKETPL